MIAAPPRPPSVTTGNRAPLGQRLLQAGLINEEQLRQALELCAKTHGFIGQCLVDVGAITAKEVGQILAEDFGIPYVDLMETHPEPEAVQLVGEQVIREAKAVPLRMSADTVEVAMVDPLNVSAIDAIHAVTGRRVVPLLTMTWELQSTINECFDATARASEALRELETESDRTDKTQRARVELARASEAPIVQLVNSLIDSAVASRASDIHFEPQEQCLKVRYRVDGVLLEQSQIPKSQQAAVLARLKVLCLMDITENRRPQDGRMTFDSHGRVFDVRVSSVPTAYGEKIVLRLLDKSSVLVPLSRLGFQPDDQQRFESLIRQPHGMVILVGPTGSGKSTTLYSSLNLLNDNTRNIMTLEDPVEYHVPGLNQVQINPRIGLTFASGLRTFVRQDPDVILVGEIRDQETAEMAVQAALTGHLMLSTLHTNSAVGAIPRLCNLGVDPFLIAQALSGVVSQRLVARICPQCSVPYNPSSEVLSAVGLTEQEARETRFRRGRGCRSCHQRGYLGRIAIYEVVALNEELRHLIMKRAPDIELQRCAERGGTRSLRDAALAAVRAGITTPEEMGRVVLAKTEE